MSYKRKSIFWGSGAALGLLGFYLGLLTILNSFSHAVDSFFRLWFWLSALILGFGVQMGLFKYMRLRAKKSGGGKMAGSSTAASAVSMVLCCSHYLINFLAVIGVSGFAVILSGFQKEILAGAVMINIAGITYMLNTMKSSGIIKNPNWNFKNILKFEIPVFVLIFVSSIFYGVNKKAAEVRSIDKQVPAEELGHEKIEREEKSAEKTEPPREYSPVHSDNRGISVTANPRQLEPGKKASINLSLDTHSGSLDYDFKEIARLEDSTGAVYRPLSWSGPASGEHHINGVIEFPAIDDTADAAVLYLEGPGRLGTRKFEWSLK